MSIKWKRFLHRDKLVREICTLYREIQSKREKETEVKIDRGKESKKERKSKRKRKNKRKKERQKEIEIEGVWAGVLVCM